jgi:hypothetical protein
MLAGTAVAKVVPDDPLREATMIRPMPLVRTCCVLVALSARPALAHETFIEAHAAATYHYVLGKGEAAGRSVLLAAAGRKSPDHTEGTKRRLVPEAGSVAASDSQGANRLAQCPGCAGASEIVPPRGPH